MFAVVFSYTGTLTFTNGAVNGVGVISYTPDINDVILQIVAIGMFVLSPLFVLGFWLKKKAILWQ